MYRVIILFILCNLSLLISASPIYIERIGPEKGLSNGYIMGITQDRKGFIWFSTESGLNRYDGTRFRVYKKEVAQNGSLTISGNELNKVYADKYSDIIWIATQRDGLNKFNIITEEFTHYTHDEKNPSSLITDDITDVTNSRNGNLWVATYWRGFDYLDISTGNFTHYNTGTLQGLASDNIWSIAESSKGILYLGHVNHGLTIFDPKTKTVKNFRTDNSDPNSLPGNQVYKVFIDKKGNLWAGTDHGLALFHPEHENFTVYRHDPTQSNSLISDCVYDIMQDSSDRIWIGTENGGVSILNNQNEFTNIFPGNNYNTISNKTVRSIFEDCFGNIWIGTYGDGINFISYRKPQFQLYNTSSSDVFLNDDIVMALCTDDQDRIWVGTDNKGIDLIAQGKKQAHYHSGNSPINDNSIIAAFKDSHNNLWFGSYSGDVIIWKSKSNRFERIPANITHDIRCFAENDRNEILIGNGNGIDIYNLTKGGIKRYSRNVGNLREDQVRAILIDSTGNVWVGSFGDGLTIYDREMNEITYFNMNRQFPSNRVNHIIRDKYENIWVATGNGLVLFRSDRMGNGFELLNNKNGLNDTHIRAIAEDSSGNIWVSTLSGISMLNRKENRFYNYGKAYGVPAGDFMSGSVTTTADGNILFGSHYGLTLFNPNEVTTPINSSQIIITDFYVHRGNEMNDSEVRLPVRQKIKLSHAENSFKVSFSLLDNSLSSLAEYSYRLEGLDDHWYDTHGDNNIIFRNLRPGKYTLFIKAMIQNQKRDNNVTGISIIINPPFWATWWAKSIYLILATFVMLIFIRFYKQKLLLKNSLILEKQDHYREQMLNAERMRFFTNITHELRTPLTLILGPLDDLKEESSLSPTQSKKIAMIRHSANKLLDLINTILDFRKTETQNKQLAVNHENIELLIRDLGYKYSELNTNTKVTFKIEIEEGDYTLYFDPAVVSTIVENLLSNAVKYCDEGCITLKLYHTVESGVPFTEIAVCDTGIGIDAETLPMIFDNYYQGKQSKHRLGTGIGLALVYNLVKLHEGEIFVESEPNKGSTFRFRIHSDNKYPNAIHFSQPANRELPELEPKKDDKQDKNRQGTSKLQILVVEDNKDIAGYIEESLSEKYAVYTATNGKMGLKKAYKLIPDLIISDIMMPVMDGIEMLRQLKGDVQTSHIPIILLTAKDSIEDRTQAYETGADSYLSKPFSARLLHSRINNLLDARSKLIEKIKNTSNLIDKAEILATSLSELDSEFIQKFETIVNQHIENDTLNVNFIAEKMNMSHSTLYRKVKAVSGMTVNELIRKIRVQKAEKLLLTGKYTISSVSMMVGFNSNAYFRQCFKEEYGLSPGKYLKSMNKAKM